MSEQGSPPYPTGTPGPGWWIASDGRWYPPEADPRRRGWWLASDGRWYPPQRKGLPDAALALITLGCGVVGVFILTAFAALGFGVYALVQLATRRANPAWFVVTVVGMLAGLGWLYLASTVNW